MKAILIASAMVVSVGASAASPIASFTEAEKVWNDAKGRPEYQAYAKEFAQYNNHFHLDTKDGCYALSSSPVQLMLVVVAQEGQLYAKVDQVFSDVDDAKAQCFKKTYNGVQTKAPPFYPFVLQLGMG